MQTAGARILPEDDQQEMSREAVLLQWERKIAEAERRPARNGSAAAPTEDVAHDAPHRFERSATTEPPGPEDDAPRRVKPSAGPDAPVAERRTITITGRPGPPRRRRSVVESQLAEPDKIALWAFLLGLFLVAVAAGTAHA